MRGLRSRLILSSGASGLSLIAKVAQQLLMVPILLSVWSTQLYGEWLLISAIPIYLSLSDFGFIAAGSNELARRSSIEDEASVQRFYDCYTVYFQRWSFFIAVILGFLAYSLPLPSLLGLKVMSQREAATVFFLLILATLVSQNGLSLVAGLRVKMKFHLSLTILALRSLLQVAITFGAVWFFEAEPTVVAAVALFCALLSYLVQWIALKQLGLCQSKWPFQWARDPDAEPMTHYLWLGLEMMLMPLGQALALQGAILFVGQILGAEAVTIFSTHRTLARLSSSVLQLFSNPLSAEAGMLQRDEDRPTLTRVVVTLSRVTLWMALVMSGCLMFVGPFFFDIWTHGQIAFSASLFLPLLISVVAEALWRIPAAIRLGTNRHRPVAWGYLVFSALGLIVSTSLARAFDLPGVAIGVSFIDFSMAIWVVWNLRGMVDVTTKSYARNLLLPPVREISQIGRRILTRSWKTR